MNYFITAIYYNSTDWEDDRNHRTFGYYSTLDAAKQAVEKNLCDMNEFLYNYIVIEEIGEGIHPEVKSEMWWAWSRDLKCWEPLESRPVDEYFNFCNWALG